MLPPLPECSAAAARRARAGTCQNGPADREVARRAPVESIACKSPCVDWRDFADAGIVPPLRGHALVHPEISRGWADATLRQERSLVDSTPSSSPGSSPPVNVSPISAPSSFSGPAYGWFFRSTSNNQSPESRFGQLVRRPLGAVHEHVHIAVHGQPDPGFVGPGIEVPFGLEPDGITR